MGKACFTLPIAKVIFPRIAVVKNGNVAKYV